MVSFAPNFAALLQSAAQTPAAPAAQVGQGLGAGTGLVEPVRLKYSPKLAALIDARRKTFTAATDVPTNLLGDARG